MKPGAHLVQLLPGQSHPPLPMRVGIIVEPVVMALDAELGQLLRIELDLGVEGGVEKGVEPRVLGGGIEHRRRRGKRLDRSIGSAGRLGSRGAGGDGEKSEERKMRIHGDLLSRGGSSVS